MTKQIPGRRWEESKIDRVMAIFGLARRSALDKARCVAIELLNASTGLIIAEDDCTVTGLDLRNRQIVVSPGARRVRISGCTIRP